LIGEARRIRTVPARTYARSTKLAHYTDQAEKGKVEKAEVRCRMPDVNEKQRFLLKSSIWY
jgi:hypothetical protein